jgi:hypothetical protein
MVRRRVAAVTVGRRKVPLRAEVGTADHRAAPLRVVAATADRRAGVAAATADRLRKVPRADTAARLLLTDLRADSRHKVSARRAADSLRRAAP